MAEKIVMPKLGLTMEKGRIVSWLKKVGDQINKGDFLFEVETDKVIMEVESTEEGILRKILFPEGEEVTVETCIAIIGNLDEEIEGILVQEKKSNKEHLDGDLKEKIEENGSKKVEFDETNSKINQIRVTPVAKRMIKKYEIDIKKISGSGPQGCITKRDIESYLSTKENSNEAKSIPLKGRRKIIAQKMLKSSKETAPVTLFVKARVDKLNEEYNKIKKIFSDIHITYTDLFIEIVAKSIKEYPELNSKIEGDKIIIYDDINIGIAVDTPEGLLVPVIKNTDKKSLGEIANERKVAVENARMGNFSPDLLAGGTFTITNLGTHGIDLFSPIINYPEAAILGLGAIKKEPSVLENNSISIQSTIYLCLVFDHRIVDGGLAASFLNKIKEIVELPDNFFSLGKKEI